MTYKLKTLGVALFAVLALTAVAASAASAANYTASSYPTTGTGESEVGNDVFTTEGGTVECKSHYAGTLSAASTDLTVTPTYTNCKAFGSVEATVTGCKYTLTAPTLVTPPHIYKADVHLVSPCTIVTPLCHVTVPAQGPISHIGVTDDTVSKDVTVQVTARSINYTVVTDGFLCPFNGTGAKTGATYNQKSPITFASTNGATIDVG